MNLPVATFGAVTLDALDPSSLARFWADVTGGRVAGEDDESALVVAAGYPTMLFLKVADEKQVKNRVHLDVLAADVDAATGDAIAMGASPVTAGELAGPFRWRVLTDPEGNEFCICPLTPEGAPPSHPLFRTVAAARAYRDALSALPDEALRRRPGEGEWSAVEVAGHVVDKLRAWTQRIARARAGDRLTVVPFDQDELVRALDHQHADVPLLIDELTAAFDRFARVVGSVGERAAEREMDHPEYGPLALSKAIEIVIDSIEEHLEQLDAAAGLTDGRP